MLQEQLTLIYDRTIPKGSADFFFSNLIICTKTYLSTSTMYLISLALVQSSYSNYIQFSNNG